MALQKPQSETLSRNLNDLLQELRVIQTGIQLLTGFLLTLRLRGRSQGIAMR